MNWPTNDDDLIRQVVLYNEGGFVSNPADKGGPTNYGITQATLGEWRGHTVTEQDVHDMPMSEATAIYKRKYISDPGFDLITDMRLRTALVDAGVLFGPSAVIKALQTILGLKPDGLLGAQTAGRAAGQESRGLVNSLSVWRVTKHAARCHSDPSQVVFLQGWVARACSLII